MIYLITGQPGSGKTLHMVSMLANRKDLRERKLFVDGIPDLDVEKIPHHAMPEGCNGGNWHEWIPNGAILVIDECQRYWRPRPSGSTPPESVKAMETHRHRGVDIFLLTQHPRLLDTNVKAFVENHKHLSKSQLGWRRMFEWQRAGNPDTKQDVHAAVVKDYTLDKKAFNLYKSAEIHTKISTGKPKLLMLLYGVFFLGFVCLVWAVSLIFTEDNHFNEKPKKEQTEQKQENGLPTAKGVQDKFVSSFETKKVSEPQPIRQPEPEKPAQKNPDHLTAEDYKPAIEGQPWTAPMYANLSAKSKVKSMPYPAACISSGDSCNCYTKKGILIEDMSKKMCLKFVKNGIDNPYEDDEPEQISQSVPVARQPETEHLQEQEPQVYTLSGAEKVPRFKNDGALASVQ